ncbi:hypothetical protein GEMRC1_007457 [Eukaryota sp. GEM-RC1]
MELDLSDDRTLVFSGYYGFFLPDVDRASIGEYEFYGGAILRSLNFSPDQAPETLLCFGVEYTDDFPHGFLLVMPSFISHCVRVGEVTDLDRFLCAPSRSSDISCDHIDDLALLTPRMPDDVEISMS